MLARIIYKALFFFPDTIRTIRERNVEFITLLSVFPKFIVYSMLEGIDNF